MTTGHLDEDSITVHVPPEPPMLTRTVSRVLLGILVELTDVEILDQPQGGAGSDC
jgi:hypothetical protein